MHLSRRMEFEIKPHWEAELLLEVWLQQRYRLKICPRITLATEKYRDRSIARPIGNGRVRTWGMESCHPQDKTCFTLACGGIGTKCIIRKSNSEGDKGSATHGKHYSKYSILHEDRGFFYIIVRKVPYITDSRIPTNY